MCVTERCCFTVLTVSTSTVLLQGTCFTSGWQPVVLLLLTVLIVLLALLFLSPGSLLGSPGLPWVPLGSPGLPWAPLGSPGLPWAPLGSPGFSWAPLGSPGLPWVLLGSPGLSWAPLGSPGFSWANPGPPGLPWAPLGSPGLSWAPLGSPGFSWVLLGSLGFPWALLAIKSCILAVVLQGLPIISVFQAFRWHLKIAFFAGKKKSHSRCGSIVKRMGLCILAAVWQWWHSKFAFFLH